jgi:RsiW-degrading membrane proteinase PrsW (M82 family)
MAGVIPSLIWLWFWLREDSHAEPRSLIAATFVAGMLAVLFAIIGEKLVSDFISDQSMKYTAWAAIEETCKFIIVGIVALSARSNDEPIDAMIYCIVCALGFAALENSLFIMNPLTAGEISTGITTGSMRFIGATLVHIVSSATIGFMLGMTFYKNLSTKIVAVIFGLFVATAIHASFNISLVNGTTTNMLATFGWVWGAVVILIILFEELKELRPKFL